MTYPKPNYRSIILDTFGIGAAMFLAVWALFLLAGCGDNQTTIFVEDDVNHEEAKAVELPETVAYASAPMALFPDSAEVMPRLPEGFQVSEVHGLYGRIPYDTVHTIAFIEDFPPHFMAAAEDAVQDIADQTQFRVQFHVDDSTKPDVVVVHSASPLSTACTGEDQESVCWTGNAGCRNSEYLGHGFYACRQWIIQMHLPNMAAWAEWAHKPLHETEAVLFEHEIGHTLGLSHEYDEDPGLMAPTVFVANDRAMRPVMDRCHRAVLNEFARTEESGLHVLGTPDKCQR